MTTPEFYYGPESYSGPFLSASEDPPEVEAGPPGEYDELHTAQRVRDLITEAQRLVVAWDHVVRESDYAERRRTFEAIEKLAIQAELAISDILLNVTLKVDEFDKELGL